MVEQKHKDQHLLAKHAQPHNNSMRIAFLCSPHIAVPPRIYGGTERIIALLAEGLAQRGHDVVVFCARRSEVKARKTIWPYNNNHSRIALGMNSLRMLASCLRRHFDIISCHADHRYLRAVTGLPIIKHYTFHVKIDQCFLSELKARHGSELILSGVSRSQVAPFSDTVPYIHHGVDTEFFSFQKRIAPDAPMVFLGHISHDKGTDIAVDLARTVGRKLILAGIDPDPQGGFFAEKIQPYLHPKGPVHFVGGVDDAQKRAILQGARCLLMPVRVDEAFGLVMVEAMSCGTPVVGLANGSVPEIVASGVTGYVCQSFRELQCAVDRIEAIDRSSCSEVARGRFSATRMIGQYEDLFIKNLLQRDCTSQVRSQ